MGIMPAIQEEYTEEDADKVKFDIEPKTFNEFQADDDLENGRENTEERETEGVFTLSLIFII